mmetsp:Transcript_71377/g.119443  ORF Transcript_71377/g.119443 Transcript_71377/m.119443 type:complete len:88 (-) Transcript_71377:560-823(-)
MSPAWNLCGCKAALAAMLCDTVAGYSWNALLPLNQEAHTVARYPSIASPIKGTQCDEAAKDVKSWKHFNNRKNRVAPFKIPSPTPLP